MITVSTQDYERLHGTRPRGRGTWIFFFQVHRHLMRIAWSTDMGYAEALREATARARRDGYTHIDVGRDPSHRHRPRTLILRRPS